MLPQALALFGSDLRDHPRSGQAAAAAPGAHLKAGGRVNARRHFEFAFSFTMPLQGYRNVLTRLTMWGATLKGRWEDVKSANSGPVELALAPRRP